MKPSKRKTPTYDLSVVKRLVLAGCRYGTRKGFSWLDSHGYDLDIAWDVILSLEENEFEEALAPTRDGGVWADVYRCAYEDDKLAGQFYVKFLIEEDEVTLVLLSCKEWGYGW